LSLTWLAFVASIDKAQGTLAERSVGSDDANSVPQTDPVARIQHLARVNAHASVTKLGDWAVRVRRAIVLSCNEEKKIKKSNSTSALNLKKSCLFLRVLSVLIFIYVRLFLYEKD
jgi:hypothetical protein